MHLLLRFSWRRVFLCVLMLAQGVPSSSAVSAQALGGRAEGQVVDAVTAQPIAGAVVTFLSPSQRPTEIRPVRTGADGRFTVFGPAGQYSARVTADGYAPAYHGMLTPVGLAENVPLVTGQTVEGVNIRLWRAGAIEGTVTDDEGRPVTGVTVEIRRYAARGLGGQIALPEWMRTDRFGRYRFDGLIPTDYLVGVIFTPTTMPTSVIEAHARAVAGSGAPNNATIKALMETRVFSPLAPENGIGAQRFDVSSPDGPAPRPPQPAGMDRPLVYRTTFYPQASTVAEATPVRVSVGETRIATDFQLAIHRTVRVSGLVAGPDGPAAYVGLRLVAPPDPPAEANEFISLTLYENATTVTDEHGAFTLLGVPAGSFRLTTAPAGRLPWVDRALLVADADVTNLTVSLQRGIRVHGRVVFDGDSSPPNTSEKTVARLGKLVPTGYATPPGAAVNDDGTFVTPEYEPGRFMVLPQPIGSWQLRSAMLDGRDVSLVPLTLVDKDLTGLVLTYSLIRTALQGRVIAEPDGAAVSADILIFPTDYEAWFREGLPSHLPSRQLRRLRTTRTGDFAVSGLAAGDYLIAAFQGEDAAAPGADFLRRVAQVATRVSLREGERTPVTLVRIKIP